jgi:hypothetical protein
MGNVKGVTALAFHFFIVFFGRVSSGMGKHSFGAAPVCYPHAIGFGAR